MTTIGKNDSLSMSTHKMLQILKLQQELFAYDNKNLSNHELTRKAQELVAKYESYLSNNSDDVNALILYGKFLRKVGQDDSALGIFLDADSLNPKLAVVKQQIANYLVEKGKTIEALPFFIEATEIEPASAEYHFHLGNFLYIFKEEILLSKILTEDDIKLFTHQCFANAANFKSSSLQYRLRYAQSFFDLNDFNKTEALDVWTSIIDNFEKISKTELDYMYLCIARILTQMNNKKGAKIYIEKVSTKSLEKAKHDIESLLEKSENQKIKKSIEGKKTGAILKLKDDLRLKNLQKITARLKEENLIKDLEIDRIEAYHNDKGDLKLSVSNDNN